MGEIARRSRLLEDGYSDHEVRQLYRRHDWRRLGHGCYVPAADYTSADLVARHRLLIESTLTTMADDAVVSHESAAVLYGLPIWALALDVVHVTRDRRNGGRIRPTLKVHCAPIDDGVATLDGRLVTSPARTVVDIGRSVPFEQAVVIGDAAVRSLGIAPTELAVELERAKRRRGASRARRVIAFVDPRSESVGESRSRVMFHDNGIPMPVGQVDITDPDGSFIGRADFYWERCAVIGEFDGRLKYGKLLMPGHDPGDIVFAEKRREDALRAAGFGVVRWTWDELTTARPAELLRRAFAMNYTPTGQATPAPLTDASPPTLHPLPHTP